MSNKDPHRGTVFYWIIALILVLAFYGSSDSAKSPPEKGHPNNVRTIPNPSQGAVTK
jgi:hypothetical protein